MKLDDRKLNKIAGTITKLSKSADDLLVLLADLVDAASEMSDAMDSLVNEFTEIMPQLTRGPASSSRDRPLSGPAPGQSQPPQASDSTVSSQ